MPVVGHFVIQGSVPVRHPCCRYYIAVKRSSETFPNFELQTRGFKIAKTITKSQCGVLP